MTRRPYVGVVGLEAAVKGLLWLLVFGALLVLSPSAKSAQLSDARTKTPLWVSDQTNQMPYVCLKTLWVDPLHGTRWYSGADGSRSRPYLLPQDLNGSGSATLGPGVCINLINDAEIVDQWTMTLNQRGGSNTPAGFIAIRSVNERGDLVPAVDPQGQINRRPIGAGGPARWRSCCNASAAALNLDQSDYVILDGVDWTVGVEGRIQSGGPCVSVGQSNIGPNSMGPSHVLVRNNYVHGCGGGGIMAAAVDFFIVQNNVCAGAATSSAYQESCFSTYQARSAPGSRLNDVDRLFAYHQVFSDNVAYDAYEAAIPPGSRTDGNCLIIDDNLNSQNHGAGPHQTNAGPFSFRTLISRNQLFHCGAKGVQIFQSQHVDVVNNLAIRNNFDAGNPGVYRGEISTNQALDVNITGNVAFSVGAKTRVRRSGSGVYLAVDDVSAYFYAMSGLAPSPHNPIAVTVSGAPVLVSGVAADFVNTSATLWGVSGVLTLTAPVAAGFAPVGAAVLPAEPGVVASSYNSGLFDGDGSATVSTCRPWSPICSGRDILTLATTSSTVVWRRNRAMSVNGAAEAVTAGSSSSPSPPKSVAGEAAGEYMPKEPPPSVVTPGFSLNAISLIQPGHGCSPKETLRLLGGRSSRNASIVVDALRGSGIGAFHVEDPGLYDNPIPASLMTATSPAGCAAAVFQPRSSLQLLELSGRP